MSLPSRARIPPRDEEALRAAQALLQSLAKPPGSLGRLETLGAELAAMTGRVPPSCSRKAVVVMAADHGVVEESVSAYPAEVTAWMVQAFLSGRAAVNVLADQAGAQVICVDVGVREELAVEPDRIAAAGEPGGPGGVRAQLVTAKVRRGTANMTQGPAMTREEALQAFDVGEQLAQRLADEGVEVLAGGDMGIGNTTASAAVIAALSGTDVATVVGPGTGLDAEGLRRKRDIVRRALERNRPDPKDPLGVLAAVGGLELAALAGLYVGAAQRRLPVVVDGVICAAAALAAEALMPGVRDYMIAGHLSAEPGHRVALQRLGLQPYLDLGMRLGEGTGAVLAFHLIDAAGRLMRDMATLASLKPWRAESVQATREG